MILRQNLPIAVRVNVIPMRRRKRGLGDTMCTPTSCAGPYDNPVYNYDYWFQQASNQGYQPDTQGSQTEALDTTEISGGGGSNPSGDWASYAQMAQAACVENCGIYNNVSDQYACSQRNAKRDIQISNLQAQYNSAVPASALSSLSCTPGPAGSTPTFPTTPSAPAMPSGQQQPSGGGSQQTPTPASSGQQQPSGGGSQQAPTPASSGQQQPSGGGSQQTPAPTTGNWFTEEMISGVPNWALLAAAAAVAFFAFGGKR